MSYIDTNADTINASDLTDRVEELEETQPDMTVDINGHDVYTADYVAWALANADAVKELAELRALLDDLRGNGGDHQWRGDWYPGYLVRDSYFVDYARETVQDCGYVPEGLPDWVVVDWDATADNVRFDYTSADIDGVTYWFR
jgi:hypothetical protein